MVKPAADDGVSSGGDAPFYVNASTRAPLWRAWLGSNQQPLPSEGSTLSIELQARSGNLNRSRPRSSPETRRGQAFLAQALHQPLAETCLPAKSGQPPAAEPALPW